MLWPLLVYAAAVVAVVGLMIGGSALLGERGRGRARGEPYESGVAGTGQTHPRYGAHFYLMAMFFLIFDLEAVFLFAWAVAAPQLGWRGYGEALVFAVVLLVGLGYLWSQGALNWGPRVRLLGSRARSRRGPQSVAHEGARHEVVAEQAPHASPG